MAYYGLNFCDDLHHNAVHEFKDWRTAPTAPLPSWVDTGTVIVDKGNLAAYREALAARQSRCKLKRSSVAFTAADKRPDPIGTKWWYRRTGSAGDACLRSAASRLNDYVNPNEAKVVIERSPAPPLALLPPARRSGNAFPARCEKHR